MSIKGCGSLGFAAAVMVGCSDAPSASNGPLAIERDTSALYQTDSLSYTLIHHGAGSYNLLVTATLTNKTGGPIYISNCAGATGIYLEKQTSDGWQIVRSPILPGCLSPAIVVATGANYSFSVGLDGGDAGSNIAPKYLTTDLNGEYRLLWDGTFASYDANTGTGAAIPETSRVSNRFLVRVVER